MTIHPDKTLRMSPQPQKFIFLQGILPGKYQLNDLADFQDLPELKPRYTEIRNVVWKSGSKNIAGTIDFPASFDGLLEVEFATNELLEYYGCSIANTRYKICTKRINCSHCKKLFIGTTMKSSWTWDTRFKLVFHIYLWQ